MQQIYEVKVITLTRGGLAGREICSNNELLEVSRGHSTEKTGTPEKDIGLLQEVVY